MHSVHLPLLWMKRIEIKHVNFSLFTYRRWLHEYNNHAVYLSDSGDLNIVYHQYPRKLFIPHILTTFVSINNKPVAEVKSDTSHCKL